VHRPLGRAGAVATQAWANPRYGPEGLALPREGVPVEDVFTQPTARDENLAERIAGADIVDPVLLAQLRERSN
jgi:uncharacterized Ntn-hydrolase superfamily protein